MKKLLALVVWLLPVLAFAQSYPSPTYNVLTLQTPLAPGSGGTGVANANALTLGGPLTTSGAFALTLTTTAATSLTLPTSGTLLTTAGASGVYAPLASPTFTGTVTIPSGASISGYAPLASPTFTGTVTIPSGASISGYAPLASPTFTGSVVIPSGTIDATTIGGTTRGSGAFTTLTASSTITPSQTSGIVGTTTNNNANAGSDGEYQSNSTTATSLTTATAANSTSVSLTSGDWDVSCVSQFVPAASTTMSLLETGINTTSATFPTTVGTFMMLDQTFTTGTNQTLISPLVRESLASTTTVYCVAQATFATSTMTVNGFIRARRVR